jgi:hypothetical protein
MVTRTRQSPPQIRATIPAVPVGADNIERLEAYCMRRSTVPPYKELKPSTVVRRAVLYYLAQLEAVEASMPNKYSRPACVVARGAGGLLWCPEHDVRWELGDKVPETCRGSNDQ